VLLRYAPFKRAQHINYPKWCFSTPPLSWKDCLGCAQQLVNNVQLQWVSQQQAHSSQRQNPLLRCPYHLVLGK
jgi:hypothetical protein